MEKPVCRSSRVFVSWSHSSQLETFDALLGCVPTLPISLWWHWHVNLVRRRGQKAKCLIRLDGKYGAFLFSIFLSFSLSFGSALALHWSLPCPRFLQSFFDQFCADFGATMFAFLASPDLRRQTENKNSDRRVVHLPNGRSMPRPTGVCPTLCSGVNFPVDCSWLCGINPRF